MSDATGESPYLTPEQQAMWTQCLKELNEHNVLCHCRICDREWVASTYVPCECGSRNIEYLLCWQFPDG